MILLSYIAYFVTSTIAPLVRRSIFAHKDPDSREQIFMAFQTMLILTMGSLLFQFFFPLYFAGSLMHLFLFTLICGVCGSVYFIANYTSQKYIDAGITVVVLNIYTPVTIILASLFLHEKLTPVQIIGTVFLLLALVIISKKHKISRFKFDKHFTTMLLGGVLLGILLTAERALQKQTGLAAATMLSWGAQCFFIGIATLFFKAKSAYNNREILTVGILNFLSSVSFVVLVFTVGNLSLVASVTTFLIVCITIAAAIFLKERENMGRKILGSVIAVIGLLLMR
jgi:drug/metabolite transporter (DMT)-like permease